ncbi:TonB-dependent receptor domain-containing protein [Phenylobacterium sp.]|uniref:TonB-dependent receptor domain-containing protein n=1 Tax=Phenylobacterium sp. TaxID=1871053 RepID=UPI002811F917|nr:TonB-dependent receptor [Phenylobacterium sp.]
MSRITVLAIACAAASPAAAQDSAVRSAADAFGERVGIEQIGLYNEGQVRGFDLNASGAYRIEDAYFSRAAPLNDPVLAGVGVRVGVNAARLAYPAPSGVVNYRLREPGPRNGFTIGAGLRDYGTPTIEFNGSWKDEADRFSLAGGAVWRPIARWGAGTEGEAVDVGIVGRWRISETQTLRAFATTYDRHYDGDFAFHSADGVLPPDAQERRNYSPEWARVEATSANLGALYNGRFNGWSVDLSAFRSVFDLGRSDFTLIETRADGSATATAMIVPAKTNTSDSAEARLSRVFEVGAFSHLLSASVRGRKSEVELASTLFVPLGALTLDTVVAPSSEPVWSGTRGLDVVEQVTGSVGYGLVWADRLQVRLGAHRTRYEKTVDTLSGARTRGVDQTTLYNASAVWSVTSRTALFASWVTGLEESGVAPQTATNRDEVLAPVEAEQYEVGVRHAVTSGLTFIGALFEVSKPTTGFRADGSFAFVGEVAHRGVEGSLAGRLDDKTSIVLGAVAFQPEVTGPLVEAGVVGERAAGISSVVANASVERQLGAGWSVDAQLTYSGDRWADTRNTFKTPAQVQVNLGARRRFELQGRPATLRVLASNITGADGYWGSPSGLLWPITPPTVRAMLTIGFGG